MRNKVITLITQGEEIYDDDGFLVSNTEKRIECYAQVKSTTRTEYYSADKEGERATHIFIVGEQDYNLSMQTIGTKKIKPSLIEYDGTTYKIIRRFWNGTSAKYVMELSCTEVESNG